MNITNKVILEMIESLKDLDIKQTVGYQTVILMRDALVNEEVPFEMANNIVASMKIEVEDSFFDDKKFYTKAINGLAYAISKIYDQCVEDGMPNYITKATEGLSLTYKE